MCCELAGRPGSGTRVMAHKEQRGKDGGGTCSYVESFARK